jgi:hypothetical protein
MSTGSSGSMSFGAPSRKARIDPLIWISQCSTAAPAPSADG